MLSMTLFHHINVFVVVHRQRRISILADDILPILALGLLALLFLCFVRVIECWTLVTFLMSLVECRPVLTSLNLACGWSALKLAILIFHRWLIGVGVGQSQVTLSTRLLISSWQK